MRRLLFAIAAASLFVLGTAADAQTDPAAGYHWPVLPWHTHQLTPNIYWVEGGGGNSGVLVGTHGIVVFDAKTTADTGKELLQKIAEISTNPVTTVILSHSDVDHVGGLRSFPTNIRIIAHTNDFKELQADLAANPTTALPAEYFPTETVKATTDLVVEGFKMQLLHWAPAHTSGDLVLYLPDQRILFCGDLITQNRDHPLLHLAKHGSSAGWITSVKGILSLDVDKYVPGHGDVITRAAIEKMLSDTEAEREKIKKMVAQGKSLADVEAATGDPSAAEKAGPPFPSFSEVVYDELTDVKH